MMEKVWYEMSNEGIAYPSMLAFAKAAGMRLIKFDPSLELDEAEAKAAVWLLSNTIPARVDTAGMIVQIREETR